MCEKKKMKTARILPFLMGWTMMTPLPGMAAESNAPAPATTTILTAELSQEAVPAGAPLGITYRFRADRPLAKDNTLFVHVKNDKGQTVAQDDHVPAVSTGTPGWVGDVEYHRRYIVAPALKDGTPLPPGRYSLVVGLYHNVPGPKKWVRETLRAGEGVEDLGDGRYRVAAFTVDPAAPRPPPDIAKAPTLDLTGYRLVFEEDFTAPLDVSPWGPGTRWIAHTPWNGDFGDARFADPGEGFPFVVEDGLLRIEARRDPKVKDPKKGWRSGLIAGNDPHGKGFSLQYGYFEMRAKFPPGPGVWSAFWLASSYDRKDPADPGRDGQVEIDIVEYYGRNDAAYHAAVHVWKPKPHRGRAYVVSATPGLMVEGFHNYGARVDKEFITFYFDGVEVWRYPTPPEHNKPLMLLANLALGPGWPIDKTPNPSYMYIDYIRAYAPVDAEGDAPPGDGK